MRNEKLQKNYTLRQLYQMAQPKHFEIAAAALLCWLSVLPVTNAALQLNVADAMFLHGSFIGTLGYLLAGLYLVRFRPERSQLRENAMIFWLASLLLWSCVSTALAADRSRALLGDWHRLDGLTSYFLYGGIFLLANRVRTPRYRGWVLHTFLGTAAVMCLLCAVNWTPLMNFLGMESDKAVFYNQNHFGYYLTLAWTAAAGVFTAGTQSRKQSAFLLGTLAAVSVCLVRCRTLGALIAVLCGAALLVVFTWFLDRTRVRRAAVAILLSAAVFAACSTQLWDLRQEAKTLTQDIAVTISGEQSGDESGEANMVGSPGNGRLILWKYGVQFITEKPLFGYGPENLGVEYLRYLDDADVSSRPHNELIQIAACLGVPALIFYCLAMWCLLWLFIRRYRAMNLSVLGLYCTVFAYLVSSLFGNSMIYTTPFFFLFLGLCFSAGKALPSGGAQPAVPENAES
ncbi:MAG: O-antigen ligase family protein [Oscillospiraceae bacterium]|nr:O-antigen ligase family protein [Oscillospiraceae bacterium]